MNQNQNIASQSTTDQNSNIKDPQNTTSKGAETEFFTVKQAAARLKTSPGTIRHYYRIGLLPNAKRAKNGYRILTPEQLAQTRNLIFLKRCGLTNREVRRYINLERQGNDTIPERKALLATKKRQLWQQLEDIQENIDFIERQTEIFDQELAK